jgi:signal transduction histidine kinase
VENYRRDWKLPHDLPSLFETFGSVICVPLIYNERVIGTLSVLTGLQSKLLNIEDVRRLELLASQAAVAISHGQLFTEQRNLTQQLRALLESTENPVIAVDRRLRLIFVNPAAEKLFNIQGSRDLPIVELVPRRFLPTNYRTVLRDIRQQRMHTYDLEINDRVFSCHLASLGGHEIDGWIAVLNDVTRLKELDRIKTEVVRLTSHDLKNPIQAALAHTDWLRDELQDGANNETMLPIVANIEKQLEKMTRITSNILDLERVRMGVNPTERCAPAILIQNAVHEMEDIAADKQIALRVQVQEGVYDFRGDMGQFERAIVNLIDNAIKFTPQGGEVYVSAYNEEQSVKIVVQDTGIGIPEELQNRIFDTFFRGKQPGAEHISGSGLGLSLVKTVIDSHKGQIQVESEPNKGTEFVIRVPALLPVATL